MPKWDFACWTRGHPSSLHRGSAVGLTGGRPRARSQRRAAAPRATWAASGTAGVRREAGLGRRRDAWPVAAAASAMARAVFRSGVTSAARAVSTLSDATA